MTERAVILAGGRGRRLAPYTTILPKPLMPISDDTTIIEHVLSGVAAAGIQDVTITLGYLGHLIEAVVGNGERFGVDVAYTREAEPLGTAGPLALLPNVQPDDRILIVNGDTFTDLDYREVLSMIGAENDAVVTCVRRSIESNYGVVKMDLSGRMINYLEKPSFDLVVSTGIYGLRGCCLGHVPSGVHMDMPDLLKTLNSNGHSVMCLLCECEWRDLGRLTDFDELHQQRMNKSGHQ